MEDLEHRFQRVILVTLLRIDCRKAKGNVKAEMNPDFMELYKMWAALLKKND